MNTKDNSGPAFPILTNDAGRVMVAEQGGMTLRQYTAIKAMQAMLSGHFAHYGHSDYWDRNAVAEEAYGMADAMLKQGSKS